jgi:hypothetical protein
VAIKGASFLEAIEAVCLASGAWYRWNGAGIELEKAQPPASRSHAGPVLLSAQLGPSHEDGDLSLNLRLEWEPGVRLRWYEIEIESAVDDQGAAVTVAPSASPAGFVHRLVFFRSHSLPAEGEARFAAEDHVDLAASTKNPARLKSARGKITFFMPEETLRVRFEDPAAGQKKEAGSLVVTLSEFGWGRRNREEWRAGLDLDLTGISASKHSALFSFLLSSKIRFVDAEGKQHDAENGGASSSGFAGDPLQHIGTSVRTSKLPESRAPKALEASIVADVWEKTYPFEFKSVEGPKARK